MFVLFHSFIFNSPPVPFPPVTPGDSPFLPLPSLSSTTAPSSAASAAPALFSTGFLKPAPEVAPFPAAAPTEVEAALPSPSTASAGDSTGKQMMRS